MCDWTRNFFKRNKIKNKWERFLIIMIPRGYRDFIYLCENPTNWIKINIPHGGIMIIILLLLDPWRSGGTVSSAYVPLSTIFATNSESSFVVLPRWWLTFDNWIATALRHGHGETQQQNDEFCHFNFRCLPSLFAPFEERAVTLLHERWFSKTNHTLTTTTRTRSFFLSITPCAYI